MAPSEYEHYRLLLIYMTGTGTLQIERYSQTSNEAFSELRNYLSESHLPRREPLWWYMEVRVKKADSWKLAESRWKDWNRYMEYQRQFPMSLPLRYCQQSDRLILKTDTWPVPAAN